MGFLHRSGGADAVNTAKEKASDKVGTFAGADFQAGAVRQGVEQFKNLVGSVDFPSFVGGLIQNVFQAIVTASIQQMTADANLLKSVAQTVDQFAQDNISLNNARDWMIDKYPNDLGLNEETAGEEGGQPRLTAKGRPLSRSDRIRRPGGRARRPSPRRRNPSTQCSHSRR
jgi:hypothetical protein